MLKPRFLVVAAIVVGLAASRLIPHPWNFTPLAAMALFGGAYLARKSHAFLIPLAALLLSDLALGYFRYGFTQSFWILLPFSYACFALFAGLGLWVRRVQAWLRTHSAGPNAGITRFAGNFAVISTATIAASVVFYLVTNFGFWLLGAWKPTPFYPMTLDGLLSCYVAGLRFFRNTLAGDVGCAAVLFGGFALAQHFVAVLREQPVQAFTAQMVPTKTA